MNEIKMMMLSLIWTLLLADNDVDDVNDANDVNDVNVNANNVNDVNVNANNADNEKRRKRSSIEEEKKSRLDTSLDRVEWLMMCYFFASLTVSQAEFINEFAFLKD
jgi:hypothetical protein